LQIEKPLDWSLLTSGEWPKIANFSRVALVAAAKAVTDVDAIFS
jgi:hypothetical protein